MTGADDDRPRLRPAEALLDEAAERSRGAVRRRRESIVVAARPIVHTSLAAAGAWLVATEVLGHRRPFFAPVAAVITLGLAVGERRRRAVEVAFGVAVGIGVGDLLVLWIGTGTVQIAVVVALAMLAALLLGGQRLVVTQAAVSAVLVATIQPPTDSASFQRFFDALTGGGVALLVAALVLPVNPVEVIRRATIPVLHGLAEALDSIATALETRDIEAGENAVVLARATEPDLFRLREALRAARESARLTPRRPRARDALERYSVIARQVEDAVYNTRVLARGSVRAISLDDATPPELRSAIRLLASAVRSLGDALDDPRELEAARAAALEAAHAANRVMEQTGNMSALHLVGQVRSTSADLLRAIGTDYAEARDLVRERPAQTR